jgi:hypothetical protein
MSLLLMQDQSSRDVLLLCQELVISEIFLIFDPILQELPRERACYCGLSRSSVGKGCRWAPASLPRPRSKPRFGVGAHRVLKRVCVRGWVPHGAFESTRQPRLYVI